MKKIFLLVVIIASTLNAQSPYTNVQSFTASAINTLAYGTYVADIKLLPDGKILMCGNLLFSNGQQGKLVRLNVDGSVDHIFNSVLESYRQVFPLPDGKILLGGNFNIIRLNSDGTIDPTFSIGDALLPPDNPSSGWIQSIDVLPNGKVIVGGSFKYFTTFDKKLLVCLNSDGSVDTSFTNNGFSVTGNNEEVNLVKAQPDGKIYVAGDFANYNGNATQKMFRINPDGSFDTTFTAQNAVAVSAFETRIIKDILIQPDGKIIVVGRFRIFGPYTTFSRNITRLNPDGTRDQSFVLSNNSILYDDASVTKVALKPNGQIVIAGNFAHYQHQRISILDPDGTFNPNIGVASPFNSPSFSAIQVLPSGEFIIGGGFNEYNSTNVRGYVKLLGVDYYRFQGENRFDTNNNGCTADDPVFPYQQFKVVNGNTTRYFYGNYNGAHRLYLKAGTNLITPMPEHPPYFTVSPATATVTFPAAANPTIQNFCITPIGIKHDMEVTTIPLTPASPGFEARYMILVKNNGNVAQSGSVTLSFNSQMLNMISSNPVAINSQQGNLTWNFSEIGILQTKAFIVNFAVNAPTDAVPVVGGEILTFTAEVALADTEETPQNNIFTLTHTVTNSYDPNDITCLEGSNVSLEYVANNYVHYLIRFENTGNGPARSINVKTSLDSSKFDISTLQVLAASHECITRVTGNNLAEFMFEEIQLPFDDADNDGYVLFKVKTRNTLSVGSSFSAFANIYFDFNLPVLTNTATTSIATLSIHDNKLGNILLYPNPVKDTLKLNVQSDSIEYAEIVNMLGQVIKTLHKAQNALDVDVSNLSPGPYFIKVYTNKASYKKKFIKG